MEAISLGTIGIESILGFIMNYLIRKILMFPINFRRKYIIKGINIRNFTAKANDDIHPHALEIGFTINSNTVANIRIKKATIYMTAGNWEFTRLELYPYLEAIGNFNGILKGRNEVDLYFTIVPPTLFWIEKIADIHISKAIFEVESSWGTFAFLVSMEMKDVKD